ncbi:hypothetical protein C5167_002520 [Papaver somniferum]|uniref:Uncharacterized protein n=1 Tax=Papaver somniferum TaxID=3469 RepID=A0A4Y7KWG6_PAPSO|nr:hypothetical protein C5167_000429 [Papaver somniferum]RZC76301.1 hypothetical protein C5167_002520 [Papaver somniferum]
MDSQQGFRCSKNSSSGVLRIKVSNPIFSSSSKDDDSRKRKPSHDKVTEGEANCEKKKIKRVHRARMLNTDLVIPEIAYKPRPQQQVSSAEAVNTPVAS